MKLVAAAVLASLVFVGGAAADSTRGVLDSTFGTGGQVFDHFWIDVAGGHTRLLQGPDGSLYAISVAVTPDSSTTNAIHLDWLTADGKLIEHRDLAYSDLPVISLADATVAPDGDIIVVTNGYDKTGQAKGGVVTDLTPSLAPRMTFGTNGRAIIASAGDIEGDVVGVEPDGEIVVASENLRTYTDELFELSAAGALVRTFARDSFSGKFVAAAVAPNGDVVFGSVTGDATVHIWRQPPGGAAPIVPPPVTVPAFAGGAVIADLGQIAFAPDGSIVVGGTASAVQGNFLPDLAPSSWVMRLTPQGQIDPTFGENGSTHHLSYLDGSPSGLAVEADGSVVSAVDSHYTVSLSRVLADGVHDASFGSDVALPVQTGFADTTDMLVEPNGRLVTLSYFDDGTTRGIVLNGFTSGPPDADLAFAPAPPVAIEEAGAWGTPAAYTPPAAIDGDGDATVTCTPAPGTLLWPGTTTVTCTAVDQDDTAGPVSISFPVTVSDTIPPRVNVPASIVREALGPSGSSVFYDVNAGDTVDGALVPVCSRASGTVFPLGTTTVTCTATDKAGNTGTASFTVTVRDTTAPSITVPPSPRVLEATGPAGAAAAFDVTAHDAVDGAVAVTCSPASGATLSIGAHLVNCSAQDAAGNLQHASFEVDVRDTTPPVLHVPSGVTIDATSPDGVAVTFTATAEDLVDGSVAPTCTPASGSTIAIGTTTVHCTATDAHGNVASGSFDVTVQGAVQQLANTAAYVQANAVGPGTSLGAKLQSAQDAVAANDVPTACGALRALGNEASAQAGRKLTHDQAARLTGDAARVRSVLAC